MVERCNETSIRNGASDDTLHDWRRIDTGEIIATQIEWHHQLPPGAMWFQEMRQSSAPPTGPDDWSGYTEESLSSVRASFAANPSHYRGPSSADPTLPCRSPSYLFAEGPQLTVVCPNGSQWTIDSRASNCTMPYDYAHRCWVRHGDPLTEPVTVDKNGLTCAAGGGSIQAGDYHGFLTNGVLTAG